MKYENSCRTPVLNYTTMHCIFLKVDFSRFNFLNLQMIEHSFSSSKNYVWFYTNPPLALLSFKSEYPQQYLHNDYQVSFDFVR